MPAGRRHDPRLFVQLAPIGVLQVDQQEHGAGAARQPPAGQTHSAFASHSGGPDDPEALRT